ncbi:MAG: dehydratase [Anaerolineae bacterium]|nr:dehydratase [Anaerolineae bacterium]
MSPFPSYPRGLYFEEFAAGQRIVTAGRTITETDVVQFAGLSGDFNQIHVDQAYSAQTPVGRRVAHGLLIAAVASGLAVQTGVMEGTVLFFLEIVEWKFVKPVFLGDTIHVELEVKETKAMRRIGGGLVTIELEVQNQDDETVNKGIWAVLIASRPE